MALLKILLSLATMTALWNHTLASCVTEGSSTGNGSPNMADLSKSVLQYTLKQYKNMITKDDYQHKNIFMSPFSIWSALTLTYLGARGASSEEIGAVLGLNGFDKSALEKQNEKFNDLVQSSGESIFKVANKIAFDKRVVLKECVNKTSLADLLETFDFHNHPARERFKLNDWVDNKTEGNIKNFLRPGSITTDTFSALINAVYFKGCWKYPFTKLPHPTKFTSSNGFKADIKMMESHSSTRYGYLWDKETGAEFVDIPYDNDKFSMFMVLPMKEAEDIDKVVEKLTSEKMKSILDRLYPTSVKIRIPKFQMTQSYDLKNLFHGLGIRSMFESIDLSAMVQNPKLVHISKALHRAFIDVNELGTVAGASTGMMSSARMFRPVMEFNRPFAFLLREKSANAVLFMGVVKQLLKEAKDYGVVKIYRVSLADV